MTREERDQLDLFGAASKDEPAPSEPASARAKAEKPAKPAASASRRKAKDGAAASPPAPRGGPAPATATATDERGQASRAGRGESEDGRSDEGGARVAIPKESPTRATSGPAAPVAPVARADRASWVRAAIHARLAGEPAPPAAAEPAAPHILTVGELAQQIRGSLEERFSIVNVRGEISNLRQPGSGHLYFTLKDDAACIRAVLFRGQARQLRFRPENGQEVIARGRIGFYESGGETQIVCDGLEPVGAGALALAFEQLKARLGADGLFDPARKRALPFLPRRIGVVTSPTGAALQDFLRVLHRRFPGLPVIVAPARVQGEGAAAEIASGVRRLGAGAGGGCDVIVITRGGGSIEDLWAFNEEVVARAIAASPIPVVSAVGHEVDFTIADFVADVRAPTPSGAAEILAPVEAELRSSLAVVRVRMGRASLRHLEQRRSLVHRLGSRLGDPRRRIAGERLRVDEDLQRLAAMERKEMAARRAALRALTIRLRQAHPASQVKARRRLLAELHERLRAAGRRALESRSASLRSLREGLQRRSPQQRVLREGLHLGELWGRLEQAQRRNLDRRRHLRADRAGRLRSLSPLLVLARGYAVAFRESGAVLLSAADAAPGERLHLEVADGALTVEVVGPAAPRKGAAAEPLAGGKGPFDPDVGGR